MFSAALSMPRGYCPGTPAYATPQATRPGGRGFAGLMPCAVRKFLPTAKAEERLPVRCRNP